MKGLTAGDRGPTQKLLFAALTGLLVSFSLRVVVLPRPSHPPRR